ncbi:hypothetical protein Tco_0324351 [Tanacetum coccineum]
MVADLRYFNSLEHEVDSLKSQLETQKTQFLNKINRLSREYYYADYMNAILGVYTTLDEFTNLQCNYVDQVVKCERFEKELSKRNTTSKSFEALQKHVINLELTLQQCKEQIKNDKAFKENQSNVFLKEHEQYFEIQDLKAQLQDKGIAILTPTTIVSRPHLKNNQLEDRVMPNNSQGKKTKMPMDVPISTREPKRTVNQSVATPLRRIFTPSRYKWKPKFPIVNVNTNVSMPLGNKSRTANTLEPMSPRCSTLSNTLLSSNSFAARRYNSIHRRLLVLKAHDKKSQASK